MLPVHIQHLVLKAQGGDRQSLELLCEYLYPNLLRYACRVCNDAELAKELTQEVLFKLSRSLLKLRDPAAVKAWCFTLIRNRCLDLHKSSYTRRTLQVEPQWFDEQSAALDWKPEPGKTLQPYLKKLAPEERDTLYFFYLEDMSVADISQITAVPVGTVKSRLFRARSQLKAMIEPSDSICNQPGEIR